MVGRKLKAEGPLLGSRRDSGPPLSVGGGRGTGSNDCSAGQGYWQKEHQCQTLGVRMDGDPLQQDRESKKEAGLQGKQQILS